MTPDGYPDYKEIETVARWDMDDGFEGLFDYVGELWTYRNYWSKTVCDSHIAYEFSTGGWSGNEDLVRALDRNRMARLLCWYSSRRGGHYEYRVPNRHSEPKLKHAP